MTYFSDRKTAALAKVLMNSTLEHYNQGGHIPINPIDTRRKVVEILI